MHLSDQEILAMMAMPQQREEAFKLLVNKFSQRLYWHLRKMVVIHEDADDLLQNTFVKVWNNLDRFRGDSSLFTWLYRIATNEALNYLNKKRTELLNSFDDLENIMSGRIDEDPLFTGDEIQKRLQKAILSLPDKQRLVFNMKYFDNLKYEEMADILNTSVGALKASYFHAVKKIEALINNELF
ncbi:RNA polymerase sigma factor [Alkalitalea saponilacus]|uniref:RNA polymerase sigma factor n=1 Tax=Alkalitalea saponilacus TaxID=889453 RepID=A0A1T5HQK6_9BACT|nr:RNA polymerase sigma factor [Alkalitalea saponilacus]ASB48430.1 RNA polymerase subunit sigma [Alkalitalea saponilacus]SKC22959.1 RNA polymerase sigma-70 factor, ECF subfamily [Alkalitalea saponilacus]